MVWAVAVRVLAVATLGWIVACGAKETSTQNTASKPTASSSSGHGDAATRQTKPPASDPPPPQGEPLEVRVTGRQWYWTVEYPDHPLVQLSSAVDDVLVTMILPQDRLVRLTVTSADVLHALAIPDLRVKVEAVPGRETRAELVAREPGDYPLSCAEYCGDKHDGMRGILRVMKPADFEAAMEEAGRLEREPG